MHSLEPFDEKTTISSKVNFKFYAEITAHTVNVLMKTKKMYVTVHLPF